MPAAPQSPGRKSAAPSSAPRSATPPSPASPPTPPQTPSPTLPPAVCILGLGLIGGSLMRAASAHTPTFGWSPSDTTRTAAAADGFDVVEDLDRALHRAAREEALVVLGSPVTAFDSLLRAVDEHAPTCLLTDVGGVKGPVAAEVAELAPHARYIGSHPMTGTEHSGWAAGRADLFDGTVWVTALDARSRIEHWVPIAGLALAIGTRVVPADPVDHDDAAARISHLPHLVAAALAQVGAAGGPLALSLAAGSFTDGTRVAGTRPELVRAMCEGNADRLLGVTDELLGLLGVARGSLASSGSLATIAASGFAARAQLTGHGRNLESVTLSGDDLVDQLLAVGASGGHVYGLESADGSVTIDAMFPRDDVKEP